MSCDSFANANGKSPVSRTSLVALREIWHLTGIKSLLRLISCYQESKSRRERTMGIEPSV